MSKTVRVKMLTSIVFSSGGTRKAYNRDDILEIPRSYLPTWISRKMAVVVPEEPAAIEEATAPEPENASIRPRRRGRPPVAKATCFDDDDGVGE